MELDVEETADIFISRMIFFGEKHLENKFHCLHFCAYLELEILSKIEILFYYLLQYYVTLPWLSQLPGLLVLSYLFINILSLDWLYKARDISSPLPKNISLLT